MGEALTPEEVEWERSQRGTEPLKAEECRALPEGSGRCAYAGPDGRDACGEECRYRGTVSSVAEVDPVRVVELYQATCDNCGWHTAPVEQRDVAREWARLHRVTCPYRAGERLLVPARPTVPRRRALGACQ